MDLDDIFPTQKDAGVTIGSDLSQLSIEDLNERIEALRAEIVRVEAELDGRQSLRNAAEDVFKS